MMLWKMAIAGVLGCAFCAFATPPLKGGDSGWIEAADGSVIRDAQGKITGVDLRGSWVTDTDLRRLNELPDLTYLNLSLNARHRSRHAGDLKNLPVYTELNLYFAEYVADEGLAAIKDGRS